MNATAPQAMSPRTLVSEPSSFCSGDRVRVTDVSIVAICPICVCMPVAVTTIAAVPRVTEVFWNSMFERSPSATSRPASAPRVLRDRRALAGQRRLLRLQRRRAQDPPVGGDDVARLDLDEVAGHELDCAATSASAPSRTTFACGTCRFASASMLARALSSCREPSTTFSRISSPTITPVEISPIARLTA